MKKLLSLVLALSMMLGCFVVTSYAAEPIEEVTVEENGALSTGSTNATNYEPPKKYTLINPVEEVKRSEVGESYIYVMNVENINEYDQLAVIYASTTNVMLDDYTPDIIDYSDEDFTLEIGFAIAEEAYNETVSSNFHEIIFEEIRMNVTAYKDGEAVETVEEIIYVFPTFEGVYATALEKNYAYNECLNVHITNGLITEEQYKEAIKSIAIMPIVIDGEFTDEMLQEKIEEFSNGPTMFRQFNGSVRLVEDAFEGRTAQAFSAPIMGANTTVKELTTQSIEPRENTNSGSNIMMITRTITATNSGATLTVYGNVYWYDIAGSVQHPLRQAYVAIMDENVLNDDVCGVGYTDNNGYYSITVTNKTGILENGLDIYVEVRCIGENFTVKTKTSGSNFSNYYYTCTEATSNVKTSKPSQTYTKVAKDETKAFQIHQALIAGYTYYSDMNSGVYNAATVYYPVNDRAVSYYLNGDINIRSEDAHSWDVVIHELGHRVEYHIGIIEHYNVEKHDIGEDLSIINGKTAGIHVAWSEGWADFFAIEAQQYYHNVKGISIANIPTANNFSYDRVNISGSTYSIDVGSNLQTHDGAGEADEGTIARVLLNILSNDEIKYNDAQLWSLIKVAQCKTLSSFMSAFYSSSSFLEKSIIGEVLQECCVVASPALRSSLVYSKTSAPTFNWYTSKPAYGSDVSAYPTITKVVILDESFNLIFESQSFTTLEPQYSFTPTQTQWTQIVNNVTNGIFYWGMVEYQNSAECVTGPYYSSLQRCVFSSDVPTVSALDTAYSGSLSAGMQYWYKFTAPSAGTYRIYTAGPSDTKGDVYTSTYLHDVFDCITDDDSGDGVNFSINVTLSANQTVYIRVRGYSRSTTGIYNLVVHKN